MRTILIALLLIISHPNFALATMQDPDRIIYQGKDLPLEGAPLNSYQWPSNKRPQFRADSSGNWRGYIAHWKIENNRLYLISIDANILDNPRDYNNWQEMLSDKNYHTSSIEELFPNKYEDGCVFADWYSGILRIGNADRVWGNPIGGFGRYYSKEFHIEIKNGVVISTSIKNYTQESAQQELLKELREFKKD